MPKSAERSTTLFKKDRCGGGSLFRSGFFFFSKFWGAVWENNYLFFQIVLNNSGNLCKLLLFQQFAKLARKLKKSKKNSRPGNLLEEER